MEWVSMAEQLHASITTQCQVQCQVLEWYKPSTIGLSGNGNVFCGVVNHTPLFGSLMVESGFGGY